MCDDLISYELRCIWKRKVDPSHLHGRISDLSKCIVSSHVDKLLVVFKFGLMFTLTKMRVNYHQTVIGILSFSHCRGLMCMQPSFLFEHLATLHCIHTQFTLTTSLSSSSSSSAVSILISEFVHVQIIISFPDRSLFRSKDAYRKIRFKFKCLRFDDA